MFYVAVHHPDKCQKCGVCSRSVSCPGEEEAVCYGCGACALICPREALEMVEEKRKGKVSLKVNGEKVWVPERITVEAALKEISRRLPLIPEEQSVFAPCGVGACWACAVEVDGVIKPACNVGVREGMKVKTKLPEDYVPVRIVGGFTGFIPGEQSGPYVDGVRFAPYPEVCCYLAGCDFRCPQCQSWEISFKGIGNLFTPAHAAKRLTKEKEMRRAESITLSISGGECTLNRPWLIQFIKELKDLNPGPQVHILVATNGSLLTDSYVDELYQAGMTDIVIGLKALHLENFMHVTGLRDRDLAEKYCRTAWDAVRYIDTEYKDKITLGVGFPYNKALNDVDEVKAMGEAIHSIDPAIVVDLQNYTPEFRAKFLLAPDDEVAMVHRTLKDIGLEVVIYKTDDGRIVGY